MPCSSNLTPQVPSISTSPGPITQPELTLSPISCLSASAISSSELVDEDPANGAHMASVTSSPFQPKLGKCFPKRKIGTRVRSFLEKWYERYRWLEYSLSSDAAFCFSCRYAYAKGKVGCASETYIVSGFRNWKSAVEDFRKHEEPKAHRSAAEFLASAKQMAKSGSSVAQQLSSVHAKQVEVNRRNVQRIIEAILF